jgi:hypothetical protein
MNESSSQSSDTNQETRTHPPMKQGWMEHHTPHQWWTVIWIWPECWQHRRTSVLSMIP